MAKLTELTKSGWNGQKCQNGHAKIYTEKSENFEKSHFSQNSQCNFYKSKVSKKDQTVKLNPLM